MSSPLFKEPPKYLSCAVWRCCSTLWRSSGFFFSDTLKVPSGFALQLEAMLSTTRAHKIPNFMLFDI